MAIKNTCGFVVGRLLEIRVVGGYRTVADVDEMSDMIGAAIGTLDPKEMFSIVADWRQIYVMPPDTAARTREMLLRTNRRVLRSAALILPEHPTTNLQVHRIIREAEHPSRRHFTSADALCAWLSESLTVAEAERLRVFLESPPGADGARSLRPLR